VDRSENMRRIRSKGMLPELAVRSMVHRMGYRFRLHRKDLPGKPDLVFVSLRKVIFVHGCFWHSHRGCKMAHKPKTNVDYWGPKLKRNQSRDKKNLAALTALGWTPLVIWECETKDEKSIRRRVAPFLRSVATTPTESSLNKAKLAANEGKRLTGAGETTTSHSKI
jgi:DNA mismatch endonuclease, patch repair protein